MASRPQSASLQSSNLYASNVLYMYETHRPTAIGVGVAQPQPKPVAHSGFIVAMQVMAISETVSIHV